MSTSCLGKNVGDRSPRSVETRGAARRCVEKVSVGAGAGPASSRVVEPVETTEPRWSSLSRPQNPGGRAVETTSLRVVEPVETTSLRVVEPVETTSLRVVEPVETTEPGSRCPHVVAHVHATVLPIAPSACARLDHPESAVRLAVAVIGRPDPL